MSAIVPPSARVADADVAQASAAVAPRRLSTRHRRAPLIAFVNDTTSDKALADGLASFIPAGVDIRRGGIRAAIASMQTSMTPNVLVVDISAEDQPLTALAALANVVEPDVSLVVIGMLDSIDFYREVTRTLGAEDYLCKPLTPDRVARAIGGLIAQATPAQNVQGNSLIVVTGVRGGVGATTVAVNLAGHFGVSMHRHTVLFDPDLYQGDASFLLNVQPSTGLQMALEAPERIDALLAERAAQQAGERLDVLSGDQVTPGRIDYIAGSVTRLLSTLRRRYNFIVADLPYRQSALHDEVLDAAHQRVMVMLPNLASVRATLRLLALQADTPQSASPVLVLNRAGSPGCMGRADMEDALGLKIDVVIPDRPLPVADAATLGELAITRDRAFRGAIVQLARQIAFAGLLDAAAQATPGHEVASKAWRWFRRGA